MVVQQKFIMILHRFMSELEYERLMKGETLHNHTVHRYNGNDSNSIGFCFFSEDPEMAVHWLTGCCNTDVLVTFDVPDDYMRQRSAFYRNPDIPIPKDLKSENRIQRLDYCCESYSRQVCKPLSCTRKYRLEGLERLVAACVCSSY